MNIENVVVIGTGTMGQGIAQWFLQQNLTVEMVDANYDFALKSREKIIAGLEALVAKGKLEALAVKSMQAKLTVKKIEEINRKTDLVIEAIIEDKNIKTDLFKKLDEMMDEKTILASNTSSFTIK